MGTALDAGLIVTAIIIPVLLVLANLVLLAKYIDPEQAAGHYLSKFVLVGGGVVRRTAFCLTGACGFFFERRLIAVLVPLGRCGCGVAFCCASPNTSSMQLWVRLGECTGAWHCRTGVVCPPPVVPPHPFARDCACAAVWVHARGMHDPAASTGRGTYCMCGRWSAIQKCTVWKGLVTRRRPPRSVMHWRVR